MNQQVPEVKEEKYQYIARCTRGQSLLKHNLLLLPLCVGNVVSLRPFVFRRLTGEDRQSLTLFLHRVQYFAGIVSLQFCGWHKIEITRFGPKQRCSRTSCRWPERVHLHELLEVMNVVSNVAMCCTPFRPWVREQRLHKCTERERKRTRTQIRS